MRIDIIGYVTERLTGYSFAIKVCTAIGNLDHSLNQDCAIIQSY